MKALGEPEVPLLEGLPLFMLLLPLGHVQGKGWFQKLIPLPFEQPKWAELKRDLRLLLAALLWRPVIIPAGRQSPGLGWPQAVNKGSYRVTLISFPLQLAHLKADERDELPRRKRGNCPAATVRPRGPAVGWAVFKLVTIRQWVLTTWSSDRLTRGLDWVAAGRSSGREKWTLGRCSWSLVTAGWQACLPCTWAVMPRRLYLPDCLLL